MRAWTQATLAAGMALGPLLFAQPARAETWKVCNHGGDDVQVSIVWSMSDSRAYISKGWWRIGGHGGCATVLSGNLPIKGVFLRGQSTANGNVWEGHDLFCTLSRGELPNANSLDERACRARGGEMKAYQMHVINSATFTTNLNGPPAQSPPPGRGQPID
jgi:uncharacterized membrane protein